MHCITCSHVAAEWCKPTVQTCRESRQPEGVVGGGTDWLKVRRNIQCCNTNTDLYYHTSTLRTHNSEVTCEPDSNVALCAKCTELIYIYIYIQGVSIPMSQTFPGYSPPQNKQKSSYQHGSKNEQFPRYPVLCRNLRIAIKTAELPFHIRYDSHVMAVASYNKQVFIVHAWVVPRWLFVDRGGR